MISAGDHFSAQVSRIFALARVQAFLIVRDDRVCGGEWDGCGAARDVPVYRNALLAAAADSILQSEFLTKEI